MARLDPAVYGINVCAFLDTIAHTEGTSTVVGSDDGYNVLVGGKLFHDYSTHPLTAGIYLPNLKTYSTGAGRYQILHRIWVYYAPLLKLTDFCPVSQDLVAYKLISERPGAIRAIQAGDLRTAILCVRSIWASLPGAGYGQQEVSFDTVAAIFQKQLKV